jgi:hypothetical protein
MVVIFFNELVSVGMEDFALQLVKRIKGRRRIILNIILDFGLFYERVERLIIKFKDKIYYKF